MDPPFSLVNGGWYFIACLIEPDNKTAQYVVGDRGSGTVWASEVLSFTGELNRSCTADLILGMHADSYWVCGRSGRLVSGLRHPAYRRRFGKLLSFLPLRQRRRYLRGCGRHPRSRGRSRSGLQAVFILREGVLTTAAADCNLSGTGRVSVTSEYISGTTAVSLVETSTSDDLEEWSDWAAVPADGRLASPNRAYIRFRVTLTTSDTSRTQGSLTSGSMTYRKRPMRRSATQDRWCWMATAPGRRCWKRL